jgi:hypothetical protein
MKKYEYSWRKLDLKDGGQEGNLDISMDMKMGLRMVRSIWRMLSYRVIEKEGRKGTRKQGFRMGKWRSKSIRKASLKV